MPHEWSLLNGNLLVDNSAALMDGSGGYHHNVRWTYVYTDSGVVIDPHVGFYRNPPPDAKCRWSTNYGEREPHGFNKSMLTMPERDLWLWNDNKLKTVADQYKQKFWKDLKSLVRPNTFLDLYDYFDAGTLWYAGAYNLWNLMNMLVTEAHQRWPVVLDQWKIDIEAWVRGLLYEWDGFEYNQNALTKWDMRGDPLVDVRFNEMFNVNFDEMGPPETTILRDVLVNHFYLLTGEVPCVGRPSYPYYPRPFGNDALPPVKTPPSRSDSSLSSSSKAIVIVSSDMAKRSSSDVPKRSTTQTPSRQASLQHPSQQDQSPQQPSPPASLTSIPEEAIQPSSPADKVEAAKEAVAETTLPKLEVVTEAKPVQDDLAIRDRKDSNGSLDAVFYNSSPGPHLTVSGRHLSTRSAPEEPSEPMLGTTAAATAKKSPAKTHQLKQQQTPSKSSSPSHSFKSKGKGKPPGPWRLDHKSPPRNTSGPPYHQPIQGGTPPRKSNTSGPHQPSGAATPPRNAHTGPPSYVPSPAVVPNHLPPHPAMMSGPPGVPLGPHPPQLHGLAPALGPPPPPFGASGMGPAMGPAMPFQNQLPVQQRPPMGQPTFHQGMPPQPPVVFPNATPPFQHGTPRFPHAIPPFPHQQQHGAPDFQARQHSTNSGGFPGGGGGQKSNRRDSSLSNASRKVRDDPVHGAVYSLRDSGPRKKSNGSSTRRPSLVSNLCRNHELEALPIHQLFPQTFRECPCSKCDEASRSIYVKGLSVDPQARQPGKDMHQAKEMLKVYTQSSEEMHYAREILSMYFGYLSPLVIFPKRHITEAVLVFRTCDDAVQAVNDFQHNPDKSIRGLSPYADVWYPLFSKYYSCRENYHRGPPGEISRDRDETHRRYSQSRPRQGSWRNAPLFPGREQPVVPQQFPVGDPGSFVPLPPTTPQRTLWMPNAETTRNTAVRTLPVKAVEKPGAQMMKPSSPAKKESRAEELRMKEDWRSKPPSEEVIEDEGDEQNAPVDTVSNHSSQGARSIVVCLPSPQKANNTRKDSGNGDDEKTRPEQLEQIAASSRAVTPEPRAEQAPAVVATTATAPPPTEAAVEQKKEPAIDEQAATEEAKPPVKNFSEVKTLSKAAGKQFLKKSKNKRAAAEEKATSALADPSHEHAAPGAASTRGYRKTTSDLAAAVTAVWLPEDTGTVIHRKQPRPGLPFDWSDRTQENEQQANNKKSNIAVSQECPSSRLLDLSRLLEENLDATKLEATRAEATALEGTKKILESGIERLKLGKKDDDDEAHVQQEPPQQPPRKKTKHKKEGKAQGAAESGRTTPADAHLELPEPFPPVRSSSQVTTDSAASRGPSPAMQSHEDSATSQGTSQGSKNHKKNNNRKANSMKRFKNRSTSSDLPGGQAKSDGFPDEQGQGTGPGGPPATTPLRTELLQPKAEEEFTMPPDAAGSKGTAGENTTTVVADTKTLPPPSNKDQGGYRAHNGGSLRMKKNRSPEKARIVTTDRPPQEHASPAPKRGASTMPTIFEPPSSSTDNNQELTNVSLAEPGLFRTQKSSYIDDVERQGGATAPAHLAGAARDTTGVGGGSQLTVTPRSWSGVVKNEDPFVAVGEGNSAATATATTTDTTVTTPTQSSWIKDSNTARSPKKQPNTASPTPSPEKKKNTTTTTTSSSAASHRHTKSKTKLSATAPLFVSSRDSSPAPPPKTKKLDPSVEPFAASAPPSPARGGNDDKPGGGDGDGATADKVGASKPSSATATTTAAAAAAAAATAAPPAAAAVVVPKVVDGKKENMPPPPPPPSPPNHARKPSLPGQRPTAGGVVDKRFVTPASQIADPMAMTQPGAPLRENSKASSGQVPPPVVVVQQEAGQDNTNKPKEEASVNNNEKFLPLGEAAAAAAVHSDLGKHLHLHTNVVAPLPRATSRAAAATCAKNNNEEPPKKKAEAQDTEDDAGWRVVSSNKKTPAAAAAAGGRGGGSSYRGGRGGGGWRGGAGAGGAAGRSWSSRGLLGQGDERKGG